MTPEEVEAVLAEIPPETQVWSHSLRKRLASLPADREARIKALIGSLSHCRTNTEDYLARKWAEVDEEGERDAPE